MKRFTKTLLSVAAVSAVSAAMAVSAMADMTATYNADTGTVTLSGIEDKGASQTLLVLSGKEASAVATEDTIKQIDQKDDVNGNGFDTAPIPVGKLADGTYCVRVSGTNGRLQSAEFTVGGKTVKEHIIGNVNGDTKINSLDVSCVLEYTAFDESSEYTGNVGKPLTLDGDAGVHTIGNVNGDIKINSLDVSCILEYTAFDEPSEYTGRVGDVVKYVVQ